MQLSHETVRLRLLGPARIARPARSGGPLSRTARLLRGRRGSATARAVWVELRADGHSGYGEGHPLRRFGESVGSARRALERARGLLGDHPLAEDPLDRVRAELRGELAAKCALDAALHDLRGKLLGQPVWRMLGLPRTGPPTSETILLDQPEAMAGAARQAGARAFRLKLKLAGDGHDLERVSAVREATTAR